MGTSWAWNERPVRTIASPPQVGVSDYFFSLKVTDLRLGISRENNVLEENFPLKNVTKYFFVVLKYFWQIFLHIFKKFSKKKFLCLRLKIKVFGTPQKKNPQKFSPSF